MGAWDDQPLSIDDTLSVYERMWDGDEWQERAELMRLQEQAEFLRSIFVLVLVVACIVLAGMVTGR